MFEYTSGTFNVSVSGGSSPYTYKWYSKNDNDSYWNYISSATTNSHYHTVGSQPGETIKVEVTYSGSEIGSGQHYVSILGSGFKVVVPTDDLPESYSMKNNYPNPFNPSTEIKYSLPEAANVNLKVYNVMGQEVATLINNNMSAGFHSITFDANTLPSGVYIARMNAVGQSGETFTQELKMQLIKKA
jgi:hypothetical protein